MKDLFRRYSISVVCFIFIFSNYVFCQNGEDNSNNEISKKAEQYFTIAYTNGSQLAYVISSLLSHKYPEEAKQVKQSLANIKYRLSPISLAVTAQGGITWSATNHLSDELDLLTGKRAIDESLQLGSIDQNIPAWRATPTPNVNQEMVELSSIEKLQVRSHPWEEMLKKVAKPEVPQILNFAPKDNFVIQFSSFQKFNQLENAFKELLISLGHVFSLEKTLDLKNKIKERLGLKKLEIFEPLIKEILFISEDLDFYPNTNYAVVISFNSPLIGALTEYITPGRAHAELVDGFLVISSSEALLSKIKLAKLNGENTLASAGELAYALAVLEKKRDGFIYLSEDFILKLVSPQYRITAARRNAVLKKLEALQYTVFAYRIITGKWPEKLSQIASEDYIEKSAIEADFEVDGEGIVRNATWGTLYDVKPISEVNVTKVSQDEALRYNSFRAGYQTFWREFFDPVGIAIAVGDQVYFHTIILPLIDNSEYKDIKNFLGLIPKDFKTLASIRRLPAFSLITTMQIDRFLLDNAKEFVDYQARRDIEKASDDEKRRFLNDRFTSELGLTSPINIFGIVGEELFLGVDGNQSFSIQNLADVDVFLGIELKDQTRFKDFVNKVYQKIYREISGNNISMMPFFQLSSEEPLQNEYKGTKYYLIPAGFVNLYFVYLDNFVYFTISQLSINRLIDTKVGVDNLTSSQKRAIDYLGKEGNALFLFDAASAQKMSKNLAEAWIGPLNVGRLASPFAGYLSDIDILIQSLDDKDNIAKYFPFLPSTLFGAKISVSKNGVKVGDKNATPLKDVKFDNNMHLYGADWLSRYSPKNGVEFSSLQTPEYVSKLIEGINKLRNFGVMFKFTEHGLDTKVVVNNPLIEASDNRFPENQIIAAKKSSSGLIADTIDLRLVLFLVTLFIVGIVVFLVRVTKPRN